jgi:metal transporter CNNM
VPAYVAIFISTAAVVIFGEVLPQAYCTGAHKTAIGYYMSPFIRVMECILYPFVRPIVMLLDRFIEHDEGKLILTHDKIKSLLLLHNRKEYGYRHEEIEMLQNCLDLRNFHVGEVMIGLERVFMVEAGDLVDGPTIEKILSQNYSKFPIYEG